MKHLSNLMDVSAVTGPEPVPQQRIDPPAHMLIIVKEVKLTLTEVDQHRTVFKALMEEISVGIKMQKR